MASKAARTAFVVLGVLCAVTGAVWIGQGLNLIPGSFMTGNRTWFWVGSVVALVGVVLLVLGVRPRRTPRP